MTIESVNNSSTIVGIGYDAEWQVLQVNFKSGGRYQYENVPADKWAEFKAAKSKGVFHAQQIKGRYPFCKLED